MEFHQIALFCFALACLILSAHVVNKEDGKILAGTIIFLSCSLAVLSAMNPSTFTSFEWSQQNGIKVERDKPTEAKRNKALTLSNNDANHSISNEPLLKEAESKLDERRSAEDYLLLATKSWQEKNYEQGLSYAYAGLNLKPEDIRVKAGLESRLGTLLSITDANSLSVKLYNQAVKTDPSFSLAYNNLANIWLKEKEFDKAEQLYRKAIDLNRYSINARSNLASLLMKQKDKKKEAEQLFRTTIDLDPKHVDARNNLATLLIRQGETVEPEQLLRIAIEQDPKHINSRNNLAALLYNKGELKAAEKQLRTIIRLDPKNVIAHNNLSAVLLDARNEKMKDIFKKIK